MKRYYTSSHGAYRFGIRDPHYLNRMSGYRGGIRF
ncbi:hypothetical protein [Dipodfec virus UOA04_Rod_736]|uniref:Uncharacterized protein n=1 Tax=Dipodfec virus UA06Rod_17 TaxID=2929318 RepID=A0A976N1S4_9VIRU|nr:hypothetical protein [Dipodfec virus UA06Rod_17]WGL31133.1 hypothetical protein [Dipodfec virus UOA04_Rod_736]